MITSSSILNNLIEELSKLPGVGRKSAGRLAYHIINMDEKNIQNLVSSIENASKNVKHCKICNSLSDDEVCNICSDLNRDKEIIMVVENERDLEAYESVGKYRGLYHVLGGALSPLIGIGPNELKIKELLSRLDSKVKEVIIATNSSIEGEATASYLNSIMKPLNIKITRIAQGVPMGGDIENIDELTLYKALEARKEMT